MMQLHCKVINAIKQLKLNELLKRRQLLIKDFSFMGSLDMLGLSEFNINNNLLNRSGHVLHVVYCSRT